MAEQFRFAISDVSYHPSLGFRHQGPLKVVFITKGKGCLPSKLLSSFRSVILFGAKDIFRLNCSHRRGGDFERVYPLIRLGRNVFKNLYT